MRLRDVLDRLLYGPNAQLYSYERSVFASVREELGETIGGKFDAQLQHLPYRQRQDEGRILAFFPIKGSRLPARILFNNADELCFATVELRKREALATRLTARLYAVNRRFFSVEFDVPPSLKGFEDRTEIEITSVTISADLERASNLRGNGT